MAFGLLGSVSAAGQTGPLGSAGAGFHVKASKAADPAATVEPYKTYTNASYGTGGIALRNMGKGVLHVSGVTGPIQDAYLYWAILFNTATPATSLSHVLLRPITFPLFDFLEVPLTGTLLGISADPCWGSTGGAVYRAEVPKWIVQGNGAYEVTLAKGSSGLTDGSDPWVSYKLPLAEGASLVIIGTGNYTVGIYDTGFTASEFDTTFNYTLNLPAAYTSDALWDNIGADGQTGHSRDATASLSLETTVINGVDISGPGALDNDSDWNGSSGFPLPQLWDDTGHDISAAFAGSPPPTTAAISFTSHGDCVVTIANVLAVK
jgi:hypothetical protein